MNEHGYGKTADEYHYPLISADLNFSESRSKLPRYNPLSTVHESILYLVKRVEFLEGAFSISDAKVGNASSEIKGIANRQDEQQRLIERMKGEVLSKEKIDRIKTEIHRSASIALPVGSKLTCTSADLGDSKDGEPIDDVIGLSSEGEEPPPLFPVKATIPPKRTLLVISEASAETQSSPLNSQTEASPVPVVSVETTKPFDSVNNDAYAFKNAFDSSRSKNMANDDADTGSEVDEDQASLTSALENGTVVLADAAVAGAMELLGGLREEFEARVRALEDEMLSVKRIAFMVDDLKNNLESSKGKIDRLLHSSVETVGEYNLQGTLTALQQAVENASADISPGVERAIVNPTMTDVTIQDDQQYARDSLSDTDKYQHGDHGSVRYDPFLQRAIELSREMENVIVELTVANQNQDYVESVAHLRPTLMQLYHTTMDVLELDQQTLQAGTMISCSLEDLVADSPENEVTADMVRSHLRKVVKVCATVLDSDIAKAELQRRVARLEQQVALTASQTSLNALDQDLRRSLSARVDHNEFTATTLKLASVKELQVE
jgi:hypothetical protein